MPETPEREPRDRGRAGATAPGSRSILSRLSNRPPALAAAFALAVMYALAAAAPLIAPYGPASMDRDRFYHPTQRIHGFDAPGGWRGPFVYATTLADSSEWRYAEDRARVVPLRLWVRGERYAWAPGLRSNVHLFGARAGTIHLLGTDPFGRDVLSRLLYGARVSLTVGLAGLVVSLTLGLLIGGVAGYAGGWLDALLMRISDLLLSVPALYLLIALRSVFPVSLPSDQVYFAIVLILAVIGWAGIARVVRGMVSSIRRADYVAAAEALGAGPLRVVTRHILPNTLSFVIVAATAAVPGYILGEVFLSFLGVGVQGPAASWGNMLGQARSLRVLTSFPWLLLAPATAIFVTVMAFNLLGDGLRDALDPRGLEKSGNR
ncbi:MAG: ABC transporter permease [Candidatus Eisenbacteria bacterium]|nr:ABC transporter permease [Candidatus Eisenbacteria bacterium]